MNIVLINLGYIKPLYWVVSPPMGILYLSAYLRKEIGNHLKIRIIDLKIENFSVEQLIKVIHEIKPEIIGLSSSTIFAYLISSLSSRIKEVLPSTWLVLGGPHASSVRLQALIESPNLDIVVPGEGEISFRNIVEVYPNKNSLKYISGIIWRDKNGELIENPGELKVIDNLDTLPFPAYDLIDISKYWKLQSMTPLPPRKYVSVVSSRGCPYKCMWCHRIFGKCFRFYSPKRLIEEIEWYQKKYQVNEFEFLDDNFNFNRSRVIHFAELVRRKNLKLKLTFPNAIRTDLIDEEVAEALCSAGTYMSSFSLETASPRLQKLTQKNLNIPKFLKAVEIMAKKNVYTNGFCMMGFPTETEEELQMTIDTATNSMLHTASFFTVIPFPGTQLFEWLKQNKPEKIKNLNYMNVEYGSIKINLTDLPDKLFFSYQRKANLKFFLKPDRIYRILRVYPKPLHLLSYLPIYIQRVLKGLLGL
ncbi:MAG TPA: radical SAM protein [Candidatus Hydrogenedens sp.]|nr:radical SAM protein [Candidatus Hydrogenedens sp.]